VAVRDTTSSDRAPSRLCAIIDAQSTDSVTTSPKMIQTENLLASVAPELGPERLRALFASMLRIRCLDERILKLQRAGRVGFAASAMGLEGAIIGSAAALRPQDWLWSGLREGGAALMRGMPLSEYVAQMYCNSNDTAKGRQMCNHFQHKGSHYPSWSSVIGTQIPHGIGAAFAAKQKKLDEVHVVYFGDGATSSTGFHSGLNFAAVWKVPCVFVCIDNGWAISVSSAKQTASESYADKAVAYGMPGFDVDGNDALACYAATRDALVRAKSGAGPSLLVLKTYRMMGHSSSDDPTKYRNEAEVKAWAAKDPIDRFEKHMIERGIAKPGDRAKLEADLYVEIDAEIRKQENAPKMALKTLVEDVYADIPPHLRKQYNKFIAVAERLGEAQPGDGAFPL
jgi:TPP-dependent pyruvate/acetoin dehydrogenase alpha subunit